MPTILRAALLLLLAHGAAAQTPADTLDFSDTVPVLVGGLEALQTALVYPDAERRAGISGRVLVAFVVTADGRPVSVRVVRGLSPGLDAAAMSAVRSARFEPGTVSGSPVNVRQALPVTFRIGERSAPPPPAAPSDTLDFSQGAPALVGGIEALQAGIRYPDMERRGGIEGRVIVRFVVLKDGTTTAIQVVRSVSPGLDAAAAAAVRAARFRPGTQNGAPANVRQTLPVSFRITDDAPTEAFDAASLFERLGEPWMPTAVAPDSGAVVAGAGRLVWQIESGDRVEALVAQDTLRTVMIAFGPTDRSMETVRASLVEGNVRAQPDGFYLAQDLAASGFNGQGDVRLDESRLTMRPATCAEVPGHGCVRDFPVLIGGMRGLQQRATYPRRAQQERLDGRITVVFIVQPDGTPTEARVASDTIRNEGAAARALRESALDAVRGSRFNPVRRGGVPIAAPAVLTVQFRIL